MDLRIMRNPAGTDVQNVTPGFDVLCVEVRKRLDSLVVNVGHKPRLLVELDIVRLVLSPKICVGEGKLLGPPDMLGNS